MSKKNKKNDADVTETAAELEPTTDAEVAAITNAATSAFRVLRTSTRA